MPDERCPDCDARIHVTKTESTGSRRVLDFTPTSTGMFQIIHRAPGALTSKAIDRRKLSPAARDGTVRLYDLHDCQYEPPRPF